MKILQTTFSCFLIVSLVACGANTENTDSADSSANSSSETISTASSSENQTAVTNTTLSASLDKTFTDSFLNASTSTEQALPAHLQTTIAETADVSPELLDLEAALEQSSASSSTLNSTATSSSNDLTNNLTSSSVSASALRPPPPPPPSTTAPTRPAPPPPAPLPPNITPPPGANTPTAASVVALGRVLFYDKQLSFNNTVSCASCHQANNAFADPNRFSKGFSDGLTTAHSMRLINLRNYQPGQMFWDKRAASLEAQATVPLAHPVEMGFDASHGGLNALLVKMRAISYYPALFRAAYGNTTINTNRISQALAQFQRTIVSTNSAWDTGFAANFDARLADRGVNKPIASFTAQENRGRELFMARAPQGVNCAACHAPPSFALTGNSRSNGLDAAERRIFKSPSLKSVALAGAFMHDGRFSSLEQVVEHYNSGVKLGPALDNRLRTANGQPRRLNLSEADKAALVAFLKTLTDTTLATNPNFSDPFK